MTSDARLRILLATPDYPPMSGGIQLLLSRLVAHSRHRYEVVCIGADGAAHPRGTAAVDPARASLPPGSPACSPARVVRTPRLPSHAASIGALNVVALARALGSRPDAIVSGHVVATPAAIAAQRLLRIPVLQYLYALELSDRPPLTRLAMRRAAASVAISSHTRQLALCLGAPQQRLHVIQPGVDLPAARADGASSGATDVEHRPTIITVARLKDRYKGFDVMVKALPLVRAKLPDVRWVVVGEGPLRAELQASAAALGIADAITCTGRVDDATRDRLLDEADVFAMPSRLLPDGTGGEGFGIVYLEAGSHGLPCVAGNVGGALDAVSEGETGLLVDPTDHIALADALITLLTDRDLARRLGQAGRRRAEAQSWQRMAGEVDDLIERLVAER